MPRSVKDWQDHFEDAIGQLSFGFEEGDDGNQLTLALDQIASLLGGLPGLGECDDSSLETFLRDARADPDLIGQVKQLEDLGKGSGYGDGFDTTQAKLVSSMAADVADELNDFAEKYLQSRKKSATVKGASRNARPRKS